MRMLVLALIVLASATSSAPAQAWAEKMFKEGLVHDFGDVPRGSQLLHRFAITNIYAVKMEITNVTSGCGCVTAAATKNVLEPRETGYLEVSMDSKRFVGSKSVNVRVTVGPQFVSTAELRVTANCRADIVCNPSQINFGPVTSGSSTTQTLTVEYAGNLDWQVTGIISKDVPVQASFKEDYRRPGQVGYTLSVTLDNSAAPGPLKQSIFLKTNDPASPLLPILVEGTIQASLTATPSAIKLVGIKTNETLIRRVVVRATRPFLVKNIDGLGNGLSLGSELGTNPAMVHILTFKFKPAELGDFQRELRIKTDLQDAPIVVTLTGAAVE